mmetsp:Transcript_25289/g.68704  ORF Transcript_25289/g.68704 Transcript_25289/m.68704 type:complete len:265 (+) Transcript_25289:1283-2077(+)
MAAPCLWSLATRVKSMRKRWSSSCVWRCGLVCGQGRPPLPLPWQLHGQPLALQQLSRLRLLPRLLWRMASNGWRLGWPPTTWAWARLWKTRSQSCGGEGLCAPPSRVPPPSSGCLGKKPRWTERKSSSLCACRPDPAWTPLSLALLVALSWELRGPRPQSRPPLLQQPWPQPPLPLLQGGRPHRPARHQVHLGPLLLPPRLPPLPLPLPQKLSPRLSPRPNPSSPLSSYCQPRRHSWRLLPLEAARSSGRRSTNQASFHRVTSW